MTPSPPTTQPQPVMVQQPLPAPCSWLAGRGSPWPAIGWTALSGLLLGLTTWPLGPKGIGMLPLGSLAWIALVPWLAVLERCRFRTAWVLGVVHGLVFWAVTLPWLIQAHWQFYVLVLCGATAIGSIGGPLAWIGLRFRGLGAMIGVGAALVLTEYARMIIPMSFPWAYLAHSQWWLPGLPGLARLTGAWGISFLVAAGNVFFLRLGQRIGGRHRSTPAIGWGIYPVVLAMAIVYGGWPWGWGERPGPHEPWVLAWLVQADIPQRLSQKLLKPSEIIKRDIDLIGRLRRDRAGVEGAPGPLPNTPPARTVLILSESVYPYRFEEYLRDPALDTPDPADPQDEESVGTAMTPRARSLTNRLLGAIRAAGADALIVQAYEPDPVRPDDGRYNHVYLFDLAGRRVLARYTKQLLLPVGESIPFRAQTDLFRKWTRWLVGRVSDVRPGHFPAVLTAGTLAGPPGGSATTVLSFGAPVCYEVVDPRICRAMVNAGATCLVNPCNDAWFIPSSEPEQLLASARYRAVETATPLLRATNAGITGAYDRRGQPCATLVRDGRTQAVSGVLTVGLPVSALHRGATLYQQWGDLFVAVCAAVMLGALAMQFRRRAGHRTA